MKHAKNSIFNCLILIVEDDLIGRTTLREIFRKRGFSNIVEAENGVEALSKIESLYPDMVILDVLMPEMDGIECCKRIRANPDPDISNIPILFQTALIGTERKREFFAAGATDYLSKPIDSQELTARTIVHLEREVMLKNLKNYKARTAEELDTARQSQLVLIPEASQIAEIEKSYNMQIYGYFDACSELGGDFWGYKSLSSDELAIYIIDFAGHGVSAALNVFRLHALMQAAMDTAAIPSAYLSHLNAHLARLLTPGQFATMFYGIINCKKNKLSYASAASTDAVLFRASDNSYKLLESTGTVIGAMADATFSMNEVDFKPGDGIMLFSDAVIETKNSKGDMCPTEYWADFCQNLLSKNRADPKKIVGEMLGEFLKTCGTNVRDDLTISSYFRTAS